MPDPKRVWRRLADYLRSIPQSLPEPPTAVLVVSAHWETQGFRFSGGQAPALVYDYYGFPSETYQITWPAPGAPWLAQRAMELLRLAGLTASIDVERGFDHGVFVPMKVAFPLADIPTVAMSLDASLDPALHLEAGQALAPLRDAGVLIVGSGSSFHNLRAMSDPHLAGLSFAFDEWLRNRVAADAVSRSKALARWTDAPNARASHPREEHLLPLMVAAGTSAQAGKIDYRDVLLGTALSAFRFD